MNSKSVSKAYANFTTQAEGLVLLRKVESRTPLKPGFGKNIKG